MKKALLTSLAMLIIMASQTFGATLIYKQMEFQDFWGEGVTTLTSVNIQDAGTATSSSLFSDKNGNTSLTNPIVSGLSQGRVTFWSAGATFKVTATDGTNSITLDDISSSRAFMPWWSAYMSAQSGLTLSDSQALVWGSDSDWSAQSAVATVLTFTPLVDDSAVNIGTTAATSDLNLWGGTSGVDTRWDASEDTWEFDDDAILAIGDGDDYTISHNGSITTVAGAHSTSGIVTHSVDVLFDGTADVQWDDSENTLVALDNAVIGFGNTGAAPDVEMTWDADSWNWVPSASDTDLEVGSAADGFDWHYFFEDAGEFFWDYDGDFVNLTDDMDVRFGTGATTNGDFMISGDSAPLLTIDVVAAGVGEIAIGNDADDVPLKWFGETTGDFAYFTGDQLQLEDIDLSLGDSTLLLFGDAIGTGDIKIYATSTDLIIDGVVAETGTVAIGLTDLGIDFKLWAATSAEGILWDASDEDLEFTGTNIVLDASSAIENSAVVVTDAATYQVLAASSGKTHIIGNLSQPTDIDLPPEAAGLYYRFIYAGAADEADDHTIDTQAAGANFVGGVMFADTDAGPGADEINAGVYSNGTTNSKLVLNNLSAGTVIEIYCDGSEWFTSGRVFSDTIPSFADQ